MKILYVEGWIHSRNLNAIQKYSNIQFTVLQNPEQLSSVDLTHFDCVYSPSVSVDAAKYPDTVFIFGPHFADFTLFPEMNTTNSAFMMLCDWVKNLYVDYAKDRASLYDVPFGVDTEEYINIKPIQERNKVMVYYKYRNPVDLEFICEQLNMRNIDFLIFNYMSGYDPSAYLETLRECKYIIWVGAHESQGFALQEALSCDVPLMVWSITNMQHEYRSNVQPDKYATTVPYWDERCGELFYNKDEFTECFERFIGRLNTYTPRSFILEKLSTWVCEQYFIDMVNEMQSKLDMK